MQNTIEVGDRMLKVGKIIDNPSDTQMQEWALELDGKLTQVGNLAVISEVRNRSAKFTEVFYEKSPDEKDLELLKEVFDHLKDKEVIQLDRCMCANPDFRFHARIFVDSKFARIPLMWGKMLFPEENPDGKPDFVTITIPEWPERRVMVFPEEGLTIILGTDYMGENKKAMLRQLMYAVKKRKCLGLHAGSKTVRVKRDGEPTDVGFLFFGLSGTGKTSLTCHSHWLKTPERVIIHQDDVVVLRPDGGAIGTEDAFYLKTDALDLKSQPLLYASCLAPPHRPRERHGRRGRRRHRLLRQLPHLQRPGRSKAE